MSELQKRQTLMTIILLLLGYIMLCELRIYALTSDADTHSCIEHVKRLNYFHADEG